jgi:hypothetical protein
MIFITLLVVILVIYCESMETVVTELQQTPFSVVVGTK